MIVMLSSVMLSDLHCIVKIGTEFALGGGGSTSPPIAIMIGVSRNCLRTNLKFERPEIMQPHTVIIG